MPARKKLQKREDKRSTKKAKPENKQVETANQIELEKGGEPKTQHELINEGKPTKKTGPLNSKSEEAEKKVRFFFYLTHSEIKTNF